MDGGELMDNMNMRISELLNANRVEAPKQTNANDGAFKFFILMPLIPSTRQGTGVQ